MDRDTNLERRRFLVSGCTLSSFCLGIGFISWLSLAILSLQLSQLYQLHHLRPFPIDQLLDRFLSSSTVSQPARGDVDSLPSPSPESGQ
jgi:hypothetical protein